MLEVRPALPSLPTMGTSRLARPATAAAAGAPEGSTRIHGVKWSPGGQTTTATAERSDWTVCKRYSNIINLESTIPSITSAIDAAIKGKPLTGQAIPETQVCLQGSTGKGFDVLLIQMDVVSPDNVIF